MMYENAVVIFIHTYDALNLYVAYTGSLFEFF